MRNLLLAMVLLSSACAPPTENMSESGNEAAVDANATAEPTEPDASRYPPPPPDDKVALKAAPVPVVAEKPYTARGQEPGWALKIDKGRIDYQGNYGEKLINVARPEPQSTANGRRYVTPRLTVAITYTRCNDAMSGHGYEHEVKVTADGETYDGCGGPRRTDWDM